MNKYRGKYRNGTFRLAGWNYGRKGVYFITICTQHRQHFFGEVVEGKMVMSTIGKIVEEEWLKTPIIRKDMNVTLGSAA